MSNGNLEHAVGGDPVTRALWNEICNEVFEQERVEKNRRTSTTYLNYDNHLGYIWTWVDGINSGKGDHH